MLHRERTLLRGGWLLAANHISHFDPPFLGVACLRKMDWMTSREFYAVRLLGAWMRAVDTFPVDRERPDRASIRMALARLAAGRVVGMFPEGGIRDGARSVLQGAALRPGLGALAEMSGAPVIPCVIVGSDKLYAKKNWLPFRRAQVWISFGEPLSSAREGKLARKVFEARIRDSGRDAPCRTARAIWNHRRRSPAILGPAEGPRMKLPRLLDRLRARALDSAMCATMFFIQRRHRLHAGSREALAAYIDA